MGQKSLEVVEFFGFLGEKEDFYCDNDPTKEGSEKHGIPCISFAQLEAQKEETLVLVSPKQNEGILQQLKDA